MSKSDSNNGCSVNGGGCGCGCGGFLATLVVGGIVCAFNATIGLGASIQIPATDIHLTVAGVAGNKAHVQEVLPSYVRGRFGKMDGPINQSLMMTIGSIEGGDLIVIDHEPAGTPWIDLHLGVD